MALIPLPRDFSEFLKLLNDNDVRYLLIGGYAVGYHGYVRATADMDIWVPRDESNSERLVQVLAEFGFSDPMLTPGLFLAKDKILRMGIPPMRLEISTSIDGVEFDACYDDRIVSTWDDVTVSIISLAMLKINKLASGRLQDLNDLEHLE